MSYLSLETFFSGSRDFESRQYQVLQGLKSYTAEFHHNRLYPFFGELVELYTTLQDLSQKKDQIESRLPQRLKELDLEKQQLVFEPVDSTAPEFKQAVELVKWALPVMKKAIDEGMEVFHFVDDHIKIEEVGIMPMYKEEGYWFVPESSRVNLLRYEVSIYTSSTERYRTLKTRLVDSVEEAYLKYSPESLKMLLIERYEDLPNPATFMCATDIDFPYTETFLPVAKRKLMSYLYS